MTTIVEELTSNWTHGIQQLTVSEELLPRVSAGDLASDAFTREFVNRSQPLHIEGATRHWHAYHRWSNREVVGELLGDASLMVHRQPVAEMKWRKSTWPDRFGSIYGQDDGSAMGFSELADAAALNEFIFSYALELSESSPLRGLCQDVSNFEFLQSPKQARYYAGMRTFFHGRSFTDWHVHPNDETLMCQFGLSKKLWMLPPTQRVWDVFFKVAQREEYLGAADPSEHPELAELTPVCAEVSPGDAVYIPPHWWHAVECPDSWNGYGVTLAYCWESPLHVRLNPTFPVNRFHYANGTLKFKAKWRLRQLLWHCLNLKNRRQLPAKQTQ